MDAVKIGLQVLLVITSLFLTLLILLHKGKGGGLSDMFGGGMSSALGGSSVAERNLDRITVGVGADLVRLHRRARPARALLQLTAPSRATRPVACTTELSEEYTWLVVTRSGAAGSVPARWARPSAATPRPASYISYWCANGHETRPSFADEAGPASPRRGTARAAACRPGGTSENPPTAPPKIEPYKTHLAYVKERRTDADGEAILDEALQTLRDRGLIR